MWKFYVFNSNKLIESYANFKELVNILGYDDLILKMKSKGITFEITSEEDAKHFLKEHNYYIKITSYRFNFSRNPKTNKYAGLDFFHLKELSTIDMHLKFLILKTCLNIEHALKVSLLKDMEERKINEYNIFQEYKEFESKYINEITQKRATRYTKDLIQKHSDENDNLNSPIYVYLELVSFGGLINFYNFYIKKFTNYKPVDIALLHKVKNIRNASAHNNCLIHNLKKVDNIYFEEVLVKDIKHKFPTYKEANIKRFIKNEFIQDFISLLYVLNILVESDEIKKYRFKDFLDFFNNRIPRNNNQAIFKTAPIFEQRYIFIKNILDNYINNLI